METRQTKQKSAGRRAALVLAALLLLALLLCALTMTRVYPAMPEALQVLERPADGVTVRRGRLAAAHCLFPVSVNPALSESGMRHRAAVGLSEDTDALVVAVSEETGRISVAHNGRLVRYSTESDEARSSVLRWIRKAMPVKKTASEQTAAWFRARLARFSKGGEAK